MPAEGIAAQLLVLSGPAWRCRLTKAVSATDDDQHGCGNRAARGGSLPDWRWASARTRRSTCPWHVLS